MPKEKISLNSIYISERLQKIPAACFQQRADSHNSPYGIWQNNRRKLVSVQTGERQSGFADPDQHLLPKPFHLLEKCAKCIFLRRS